jgi:hypothetical protein
MALLVICFAAGVPTLAGCGTRHAGSPAHTGPAGAGTASAAPAPTVSVAALPSARPRTHRPIVAGPSGRVKLSERDDGVTVLLRPGQSVTVVLGGQTIGSWHQPAVAAPDSGVIRRVSGSGGYPAAAPARATFLAVRSGKAVISAISDARCLHATPPCAIAQRIWQVTVVVHE